MPLFREGKHPKLGGNANMLGVRVPPAGSVDIVPDDLGNVGPGIGGMSVSSSIHALPAHRIPKRLKHVVSKASGPNDLYIWRLGEMPFAEGPIADGLQMRPASATHGLIEPDAVMRLSEYETSLAATRRDWMIDESSS